eukprot:Clim_evm23s221 gene=Clim_evmTU23s221
MSQPSSPVTHRRSRTSYNAGSFGGLASPGSPYGSASMEIRVSSASSVPEAETPVSSSTHVLRKGAFKGAKSFNIMEELHEAKKAKQNSGMLSWMRVGNMGQRGSAQHPRISRLDKSPNRRHRRMASDSENIMRRTPSPVKPTRSNEVVTDRDDSKGDSTMKLPKLMGVVAAAAAASAASAKKQEVDSLRRLRDLLYVLYETRGFENEDLVQLKALKAQIQMKRFELRMSHIVSKGQTQLRDRSMNDFAMPLVQAVLEYAHRVDTFATMRHMTCLRGPVSTKPLAATVSLGDFPSYLAIPTAIFGAPSDGESGLRIPVATVCDLYQIVKAWINDLALPQVTEILQDKIAENLDRVAILAQFKARLIQRCSIDGDRRLNMAGIQPELQFLYEQIISVVRSHVSRGQDHDADSELWDWALSSLLTVEKQLLDRLCKEPLCSDNGNRHLRRERSSTWDSPVNRKVIGGSCMAHDDSVYRGYVSWMVDPSFSVTKQSCWTFIADICNLDEEDFRRMHAYQNQLWPDSLKMLQTRQLRENRGVKVDHEDDQDVRVGFQGRVRVYVEGAEPHTNGVVQAKCKDGHKNTRAIEIACPYPCRRLRLEIWTAPLTISQPLDTTSNRTLLHHDLDGYLGTVTIDLMTAWKAENHTVTEDYDVVLAKGDRVTLPMTVALERSEFNQVNSKLLYGLQSSDFIGLYDAMVRTVFNNFEKNCRCKAVQVATGQHIMRTAGQIHDIDTMYADLATTKAVMRALDSSADNELPIVVRVVEGILENFVRYSRDDECAATFPRILQEMSSLMRSIARDLAVLIGRYKFVFDQEKELFLLKRTLHLVRRIEEHVPSQTQNMDKIILECIRRGQRLRFQISLKDVFRQRALSTSNRSKLALEVIRMVRIVDRMSHELSEDLDVYAAIMPDGFINTTAEAYFYEAGKELDKVFKDLPLEVSPELFDLYFKLRDFQRFVEKRCTPAVYQLMEKRLPMVEWFLPIVFNWVKITEDKMFEWVDMAWEADCCLPVSAENPHTSSVIDVFTSIEQNVAFLNDLGWPERRTLIMFGTAFLQLAANVIARYADTLKQAVELQLSESCGPIDGHPPPESRSDNCSIPKDVCALLNNFYTMWRRFQGYKDVFGQADAQAIGEVIRTSSMEVDGLCERACAATGKVLQRHVRFYILDVLAASEAASGKKTKWWQFKSNNNNEHGDSKKEPSVHNVIAQFLNGGPEIPENDMLDVIRPMADDLAKHLQEIKEQTYHDIYLRILRKVWDEHVFDITAVILPFSNVGKSRNLRPYAAAAKPLARRELQFVHLSLTMMRDVLYASGHGLPLSAMDHEETRQLHTAVTLYYASTTEIIRKFQSEEIKFLLDLLSLRSASGDQEARSFLASRVGQ